MAQKSTTHPDIYDKSMSLVKSVPGAQTDINLIVKRFQETGQLPVAPGEPQYADVTPYTSLMEAKLHIEEIRVKLASEVARFKKMQEEEAKRKEKEAAAGGSPSGKPPNPKELIDGVDTPPVVPPSEVKK